MSSTRRPRPLQRVAPARLLWLVVCSLCAWLFVWGCGGDDTVQAPVGPAPGPAGTQAPQQPQPKAPPPDGGARSDAAADGAPPLPVVEFTEADFVESDGTRDPFRSFVRLFLRQAKTKTTIQRAVYAGQFSLEQLRLTGVVTGGAARAMLLDPTGYAWVLKTGDYVGRAELVSTGGANAEDVAINWRIDRIRSSSLVRDMTNPDQPVTEIPANVVFIREDPSRRDIPAATRVMYLSAVREAPPPGG